jgi:hypothetical protein
MHDTKATDNETEQREATQLGETESAHRHDRFEGDDGLSRFALHLELVPTRLLIRPHAAAKTTKKEDDLHADWLERPPKDDHDEGKGAGTGTAGPGTKD